MSQRAAGDRARWLSAMLIVVAIAATSVIVRFWGVDTAALPLASRQIRLYQVPATPVSMPPPIMRALSAAPTPPERPHTIAVAVSAPVLPPVEPQQTAPAQEIAAAEVPPADPPALELPVPLPEPVVVADVPAPEESAVAVAEAALPVPSSSRGLAEIPAVAVTRAVTVAGRGIISGLRATGALVRAAF